MIGARELLRLGQRTSPQALSGNKNAAVQRLMLGLAGAKPGMSSKAARLTFPRSQVQLVSVAQTLRTVWNAEGGLAAAQLYEGLRRPLRAYPLDKNGSGSFLLLSGWEGAVQLLVVSTAGSSVQVHRRELWTAISAMELARELEPYVLRIVPAARQGDYQRDPGDEILCLADAGRMGSECGPGWKDILIAPLEAWGYSVQFLETPLTSAATTKRELDLFGGCVLLVVRAAAGQFGHPEARHPRWRHYAVDLDRLEPNHLVEDLWISLDLGLIDPPGVAAWEEFSERVDELDRLYMTITPRARNGLKDCEYEDPGRMWGFAAKLCEAARRFKVQGWTSDVRFADFVESEVGIEIAMHDSSLGDTKFAHDNTGDPRFEPDVQDLDWEPHVKVDDYKQRTKCGRIYFALDDENERLVVYHIGLHL